MAISNKYIDKITDHDSGESRPICPPAEHVSVDNENYEGETLDEVLDEVAQAIEEAGQGGYAPPQGGIPKTDLAQSVQDSLDKADSALQDEDLADYATKTELAAKQDTLVAGNGIVIAQDGKTVSVAENIRTGAGKGATAVQSITINGTPHTQTNGVVDLGNVAGEKGDKGDKGDTVVLDPSQVEQFDIINSLNAQAAGNALDAYQGARLKAQIDYVYTRLQAVYTALGNIAFWDGKPAAATILPNLDWGLPKHTLTLNLTLSNASVKVNGTAYANGDTISVEEYAPLSVLIEPSADHLFNTAPTMTFGGQSVTLTPNQDGSYSGSVVMGQSDAAMAVVATGVIANLITYGTMLRCAATTAPTIIIGGSTATIVFAPDSGFKMDATSVIVSGASIASFSNNTLVIENATGDVSISAIAYSTSLLFLKGSVATGGGGIADSIVRPYVVNGENKTEHFAVSQLMLLPKPSADVSTFPTAKIYWGLNANASQEEDSNKRPTVVMLTKLDGAEKTPLCSYALRTGKANQDGISTSSWYFANGHTQADVIAAYNAGKLAARLSIYMTNNDTELSHGSAYGFIFGSFTFQPDSPAGNYTLISDATDFIDGVFKA